MRIAVIGAGAWGTGLAVVLGRKGTHRVRLWAYETEVRESIAATRENSHFLPGCLVPETVSLAGSLEEALGEAEIVVSAMPSQHCRTLFRQMQPYLRAEMLFVSATKGLEEDGLLRMTQVITSELSGFRVRVGALSGPTFAKEVARGDPTAITIASVDA